MKHDQWGPTSNSVYRRSDKLRTLRARLAAFVSDLDDAAFELESSQDESRVVCLASLARDIYDRRRKRAKFLPAEFFGEPAWDMLLDLYISQKAGRSVDVTSLCIASAVPPTTALRWITVLEQGSFVSRHESQHDKRRTFVSLTGTGEAAICAYLSSISKSSS